TSGESVAVTKARKKIRVADIVGSKELDATFECAQGQIEIALFQVDAPERTVRLDQCMKMIYLFGDLQALCCVPQGLSKTTEMAQRQPEPCPRPSGKEARWKGRPIRDPCAIGAEGLDRLQEDRDGLVELADCEVGLSETVPCFDLQAELIEFGGNLDRLSTRFQRTPMVADIAKPRPHVGERSEEHTSELQSRFDLVCRLLLEKKKQIIYYVC